jgi:hypothetical protein
VTDVFPRVTPPEKRVSFIRDWEREGTQAGNTEVDRRVVLRTTAACKKAREKHSGDDDDGEW